MGRGRGRVWRRARFWWGRSRWVFLVRGLMYIRTNMVYECVCAGGIMIFGELVGVVKTYSIWMFGLVFGFLCSRISDH